MSETRSPNRSGTFTPCFVVGCERSGTTLLAVLLGRHSQLAMTPETHFMALPPRKHSSTPPTHAELLDRLFAFKHTADLTLSRHTIAAAFANKPATYPALFQTILECYAARDHKPLAGEKTPLHLLHTPTILEWFPNAKIVCIVRDGRDVVLSLLRMPWMPEKRVGVLGMIWVRLWHLAKKFEHTYPTQFLITKYEDLLADPEKTLGTIDNFFGLAFEPAQLRPAASAVVPAWEAGWKSNANEEIDRTQIAVWKKKVTPSQLVIMNAFMAPELQAAGYADTALPDAPAREKRRAKTLALLFRLGLLSLYQKAIEKHLPSARARRRAARKLEAETAT